MKVSAIQRSHRSLDICCGMESIPTWRSSCCWPGTACGVGLLLMTPKLLELLQASPGCTTPKGLSGTSQWAQPADRVADQPSMNDQLGWSDGLSARVARGTRRI